MSAAGLSIVNSVVVSVFVLPNDIIVFFPFECRYSFDTCPVLGFVANDAHGNFVVTKWLVG